MLNSDKIKLENKIKKYCLEELNHAKRAKNKESALNCRHRAFAVIFFTCNELFDIYNEELSKWWEEEILPQFNELIWGC